MKTFFIQTLGCKVNQYESDGLAALLRARGLVPTDAASADLRVVNTCSVTVEAASKSRSSARRATRRALPQLTSGGSQTPDLACGSGAAAVEGRRPRVIVTGCWATSDRPAAAAIAGVDAVVGHGDDVAAEVDRLVTLWQREQEAGDDARETSPGSLGVNVHVDRAGIPAGVSFAPNKSTAVAEVNQILDGLAAENLTADVVAGTGHGPPTSGDVGAGLALPALGGASPAPTSVDHHTAPAAKRPAAGTTRLPLLGQRQAGRQRAVLKIQDGCDAHCTYCIIPRLRGRPWSKPVDDAVEEARRLVDAGHVEVVLTGIFLGAYGQPTALRRRQPHPTGVPLAGLVDALCTRVPGLRRVRLSSLEPGDLTDDLVSSLRAHAQVVPHFHLPLQSGSDALLRRMNRQYGRDDFLRMVDRVRAAFDRPALTTDVIVGFPGETDAEFERTLEVVDHAAFIGVHAFPFSPRPGTAAARWTRDVVRGPIVGQRIDALRERAAVHSLAFRQQFVGQTVELLVEHENAEEGPGEAMAGHRHGRCERYFGVWFADATARPGDFVRVRVERAEPGRTWGRAMGAATGSNDGSGPPTGNPEWRNPKPESMPECRMSE